MKKITQGHSYVWCHPNGEIFGVGTVLPTAPQQLRIALPPDDPQRLSLIKLDAVQYCEPAKFLEQFCVVAGELRERNPSDKTRGQV
ncbi:MAG: hypothetical protein ACR65O_11020 [Methylomicrobium sp.]